MTGIITDIGNVLGQSLRKDSSSLETWKLKVCSLICFYFPGSRTTTTFFCHWRDDWTSMLYTVWRSRTLDPICIYRIDRCGLSITPGLQGGPSLLWAAGNPGAGENTRVSGIWPHGTWCVVLFIRIHSYQVCRIIKSSVRSASFSRVCRGRASIRDHWTCCSLAQIAQSLWIVLLTSIHRQRIHHCYHHNIV